MGRETACLSNLLEVLLLPRCGTGFNHLAIEQSDPLVQAAIIARSVGERDRSKTKVGCDARNIRPVRWRRARQGVHGCSAERQLVVRVAKGERLTSFFASACIPATKVAPFADRKP